MRLEVFREPMLDCKLVVVTDCPLKDYCEIFCIDSEGECQGLCSIENGVGYIRLSNNKVSLFVHELMHYVYRQLEELRMPLNDSTEELYSCLMEYFLTRGIKSLQLRLE